MKEKKIFLIKVKNGTPNDQFGIFSDSKKLFKAIGFRAKIPLKKGIEKFINSIR